MQQLMTEEEARRIIKSLTWTPTMKKRRKGTLYLYAVKNIHNKCIEVYICPKTRIEILTKEIITQKICSKSGVAVPDDRHTTTQPEHRGHQQRPAS